MELEGEGIRDETWAVLEQCLRLGMVSMYLSQGLDQAAERLIRVYFPDCVETRRIVIHQGELREKREQALGQLEEIANGAGEHIEQIPKWITEGWVKREDVLPYLAAYFLGKVWAYELQLVAETLHEGFSRVVELADAVGVESDGWNGARNAEVSEKDYRESLHVIQAIQFGKEIHYKGIVI